MDLLHRRLGHSGEAALRRLLKEDMATGVSPVSGNINPCDPCRLGKLTRPPHPAVDFSHGTTYALQLVVMDLAGPVKQSRRGIILSGNHGCLHEALLGLHHQKEA